MRAGNQSRINISLRRKVGRENMTSKDRAELLKSVRVIAAHEMMMNPSPAIRELCKAIQALSDISASQEEEIRELELWKKDR
jgi:hypothetical protein